MGTAELSPRLVEQGHQFLSDLAEAGWYFSAAGWFSDDRAEVWELLVATPADPHTIRRLQRALERSGGPARIALDPQIVSTDDPRIAPFTTWVKRNRPHRLDYTPLLGPVLLEPFFVRCLVIYRAEIPDHAWALIAHASLLEQDLSKSAASEDVRHRPTERPALSAADGRGARSGAEVY